MIYSTVIFDERKKWHTVAQWWLFHY